MNRLLVVVIAVHAVGAYVGGVFLYYWIKRTFFPQEDDFFDGDGRTKDRVEAYFWPLSMAMYAAAAVALCAISPFYGIYRLICMVMDRIDSSAEDEQEVIADDRDFGGRRI